MALRGEHDVGRLQIAVQKLAGVGFLERFGNFAGDAKGFGKRHPGAAQALVQCFPGDKFHDHEHGLAGLADFENLADIRMIERRGSHRFEAETFPGGVVGGHAFRQHFDGDLAFELSVPRFVNLAHASGANGRENFVRS